MRAGTHSGGSRSGLGDRGGCFGDDVACLAGGVEAAPQGVDDEVVAQSEGALAGETLTVGLGLGDRQRGLGGLQFGEVPDDWGVVAQDDGE